MEPVNQTLVHSEEFLHRLMRRQLWLSISCAVAFLIVLLGLPLANYVFPEFMARRVFGFTLTWFVLGVLFFPLVWIIAWVFIKRSIAMEEEEVRSALAAHTAGAAPSAPTGNSSVAPSPTKESHPSR